jgi:hypothetical protein
MISPKDGFWKIECQQIGESKMTPERIMLPVSSIEVSESALRTAQTQSEKFEEVHTQVWDH